MYPVLCNHEMACRHRFPSIEERVSALLSPLASAARIPTSHSMVKISWLLSLPAPSPLMPDCPWKSTALKKYQNWLVSRKYWYTSKVNGNKPILKTCSMPCDSVGGNKICEFPFWPPFSCYKASHCSFSQDFFVHSFKSVCKSQWTKLEAFSRCALRCYCDYCSKVIIS